MDTTPLTETFSKENPFLATLSENRLLNKDRSAKETRHFVVDISGSGLEYTVGDSLGIYPTNDPRRVDELLQANGWSGEEAVALKEGEEPAPLRELLAHKISLAGPTRTALQAFGEKASNPEEKNRIESLLQRENAELLKSYLAEREFIDLVEEYPSAAFEPGEFCRLPRKLVPRLYSIASSPALYPNEIHLTVAIVRYQTNNRERIGVASTYLSDRCPLYEPALPVYIAPSHFGLPEDSAADIIMVGPGTGIAPFRAFIQERKFRQCPGRNWLFFGDQHAATDYLYGEEFEAYHEEGMLSDLDLAFSRDQKEKLYVQHRMLEKGGALWNWLENGAYFYVCGDATRMAKDVEQALLQIFREQGGMDEKAAKNYLRQLRKEKRYQRDVY